MKSLVDFVFKFDILGSNHRLLYKQESSSKTLLGLFLSVCLFSFALTSSFFFGKDIIFREEPTTTMTQAYTRENQIPLRDNPIVMQPISKTAAPILETDIMDSIVLSSHIIIFSPEDNSASNHELAIERCSKANMTPENYALLAEQEDPSNYLCVDPFHRVVNGQKEKFDLNFRNPFAFYDSSFVDFVVKRCDETLKPGCSQAFNREGHIFFNQMVFESYIDFSDFDHPAKKYIKNVAHELGTSIFKRVYVKMVLNTIFTDEGYIFKSEKETSFHSLEEVKTDLRLFDENDPVFLDLVGEVNFKKNLYYRRYLKIQEVLANVGGFMKASFFFCSLIVKYYSEYAFFVQFSKEFVEDNKIERRLGGSSIESINIKEAKSKEKISFWQYLGSLLSKKSALKHSVDLYSCFKYTDLHYIATMLKKIEERQQETVISRHRIRQD